MIEITIELIPGGKRTHPRRKVIGVIQIANVGGDGTLGDYDATLDKSLFNKPGETWRRGKALRFPRKRLGPYDLLYRVLRSAVGARNPEDDPHVL